MYIRRREKTFGSGRTVPLDRNAKARVMAYAKAWTSRNRRDRQHKGPLTRSFLDVLAALLWQFHNARTGTCFPSYESVAERAGCARSTVAAAVKALEFAGALSWQHRITRIRERCTDLFGHDGWRWRVIRTSNAYVFRDPQQQFAGVSASKSENPTGTRNQEVPSPVPTPACNPTSPLERALCRLGVVVSAKNGLEQPELRDAAYEP
jgi:hypothetical protein